MLGTLVQIAKEMLQYEKGTSTLSYEDIELNRLCKDPRKGKNDKVYVLALDLKRFTVEIQDYKHEERHKYLYAVPTGGRGIGPSWVMNLRAGTLKNVAQKNRIPIERAKEEEIRKAIRELNNGLRNLFEVAPNHKVLGDCVSAATDNDVILKILKEKCMGEKYLLVGKYEGRWLGEIEEVNRAFLKGKLKRGKASIIQGSCALCFKEGNIKASLPFRFSPLEDKTGFSPMGNVKEAWKYVPVCDECLRLLNIAQGYLESHLSSRIAGTMAYVIPNFEPESSKMEGSFLYYLWEFKKRHERRLAPPVEDIPSVFRSSRTGENDGGSEFNLLRELMETEEPIPFRSITLLFYQPGRKFRFLHTTPDILFRRLQEVNQELAQLRRTLTQGALGKIPSWIILSLRGDFNFLRSAWLWPKKKTEEQSTGELRLSPIMLVEAILLHQPLPPQTFWGDVDRLIRATYRKTIGNREKKTIKAELSKRVYFIWVIWNLLYHKHKGEQMMNKETSTKEPGTKELPADFWETFFARKRLLDSSIKKALFLIGTLFGRAESIQRLEREAKATGEMPILSRLRGLSISCREISIQLFPELKQKLRQLSATTRTGRLVSGWTRVTREIEAAAAKYLAESEPIRDSEARFYFSLGWSLEWDTYKAVKDALGVEEEEEETEELESEPTSEEL
jgi:hypothetical protein